MKTTTDIYGVSEGTACKLINLHLLHFCHLMKCKKRPQMNLRSFKGLTGGSALGVYLFNLISKVLDDYPSFELQSRGNLILALQETPG